MDAYETRKKNWEDLDVTRDELNNFTECLKKEEFRKLLIEYADEVSNPDNRKLYEKEITQLEKERGVDVTFVNPEPGYVIKTSLNGDKKCFVNISKSDNVKKPTSQPSYTDGNRGLQWSIPYSLAPPREDYDKKNIRCTVFDVVFHPDTLYLASKNSRFGDIVNNTAMDGVENNYKVKLDRKNIKFPKMTFKGVGQPTVIRKASEKPDESARMDIEPEIYQKLMSSYDECRESKTKNAEEKSRRAPRRAPLSTYYRDEKPKPEDENSIYAVPKFTIKHQSDVDLQDFRDCADAKINAAIPKTLVIIIDLPMLKSANDASLDVQERSLVVKSEKPARYMLELPLPYRVDADAGNAKFDARNKKLTVSLPVVRKNLMLAEMRDSGVESDHGSPLTRRVEENLANDNDDSVMEESSRDEKLVSQCCVDVSRDIDDVKSCPQDTALRTNSFQDSREQLLNPNVKYTLPPFVCNVYDDNLAITVNVKNVDAESINYQTLAKNSGIHIVLSSVGAGFFPVYYSLCLKINEESIASKSISVEAWDNNVVFTVNLKDSSNFSKYWVGMDEEFMEARDLTSRISITDKFEQLMVEPQTDRDKRIEVIAEGDDIVINIQTNNLDSDDEDDHQRLDISSRKKERKHGLSKTRSVSESSGDELPSSNGSSVSKGILKSRRDTFSRSVSESSIDDNAGHVSSVDFHYDSIQDINSESDCSSFKKSVRFNDVVSRQLYRSNSSILGQRKKNQRKLKNKKRAHERRMSESENSETEDREKYRINQKENNTEDKCHDTVKPILNRDKLSEYQKTDNIEIDKLQNNETNHSHQTKRDKVVINDDAIVVEKNDEFIVENSPGTEFKNDLIFDLDM